MDMLPQPPPDAPIPYPSVEALFSRRKQRAVWIVGGISVFLFALSAFVAWDIRHGTRRHPSWSQAINNARQIGLALYEFENDYGGYPDEDTAKAVTEATGSTLALGNRNSNDYFRQLLAGNFTQSEKMFYARIPGSVNPDDIIAGSDSLKKGECGFSYLAGLSKVGNPLRPIAVTPLIPGTDRFDPKPFDGKAIILRVDNSGLAVDIDASGHVFEKGMNILDPRNPIWGGHPYTKIAYPDM